MVARGISIDRLTFIGYGLAQPIASNDTEEGRALNRRTEFKIIENNMEEAPSSRRQPKQQIVVEPANPETPADAEAPANPETPEGTEGAGEQNPTE